ncbi:MAG: hypothetical protein AABZ83_04530, partial [candidate division NC10 bacterium]
QRGHDQPATGGGTHPEIPTTAAVSVRGLADPEGNIRPPLYVNTLKEVTSILTPEQREKYAALAEQGRHSRHHHRRQPS